MVKHRAHFALVVGIFLLIAASRIHWLDSYETDRDEMLSIHRMFGTPEQIIHWSPPDWPPLYNLALAGWKELVGIHPLPLRMLSVLLSLLGAAWLYRLARRLFGERTALLAALAYAALGQSIIIGITLRGYSVVYALLPLAWWLALRYFDRPTLWRALPVALSLAAMFYTTLVSVPAFALIGLHLLALHGRRIWRGWLPALLALLLMLPEIVAKLDIVAQKSAANETLPPFVETLMRLFRVHAGDYHLVWLILALGALGLLLWRHKLSAPVLALLGWLVGIPIAFYLLLDPLFLQYARYTFWALALLALLLGLGLAQLPRPGYVGMVILLAALLFAPIRPPSWFAYAYRANFEWLTHNIRWGDVLLVDPNCTCPEPLEWHYYTRLYFPNGGLQFVDDPTGYRRVWYITGNNAPDEQTRDSVREGRVRGVFVGPPSFLFQLYEAPPDAEGILFDNGMRFHGYELVAEEGDPPWSGEFAIYEGKTLRVRLWWSAARPLDADYSIAHYLSSEGSVRVQFDGPPQLVKPDAPRETSRWTPGEYYVEERAFAIPYSQREQPLKYTLTMTVYQWWDNARIAAPGVDDNRLLKLFEFTVRPV